MRLRIGLLTAVLAFVPAWSEAGPPEGGVEANEEPAPEDDLLGELVVEAKRRGQLVLPKVTVIRPPHGESTILHDLLERDLGLSGEFEVIEVDHTMRFDEPFDASVFHGMGLEGVITADTRQLEDDRVELVVRLYLPAVGDFAAWTKTVTVPVSDLSGGGRLAGHRLGDGIIGALTGTDGPFASRLILVRTEGKQRRAYLIDADGEGLTPLTPDDQLVVTATLDGDAHPYWAASKNNGRYRLYREGDPNPIAVDPSGSIYGIAFARSGEVALSIATDTNIAVFQGLLGSDPLTARTKLDFALTPTFAPDGKLVFAGTRNNRRSIYVGSKAVSPKDISASNPTVCNHPDGPLLIYAVGLGKNTDLVTSKLDGSDMTRLTWARARNYAPTCSPDGRLVAFFSTRKQDEGPGLYLMRVDGRRFKRISPEVGDVLAWARIPTRATPAKTD
jgi:TolB protein